MALEKAVEVENRRADEPTIPLQPVVPYQKSFFSGPYELFISLRYLRAKRRERFISLITFFSTFGVLIGVMTLNIVLAVMTGFEEDLRSRILGFNPHVLVSSLNNSIGEYRDAVEIVRQVPGVVAATPIIYGQVMVSGRQGVSGVVVRAVEPALASSVVDVVARLQAGTLADLGKERNLTVRDGEEDRVVRLSGVVIGKELARQLRAYVGDPISLISPLQTTPRPLGMVPKVKRFFVAGIFDSGMVEYDSTLIYMGLADAQQFFSVGDRVTGIEVRIHDPSTAPRVAREIETALGVPYTARDWTKINSNIFIALELEKFVYSLVILLIVLVAAFNIIATLIMVVMEKRKDIAVLKSIGATSASISRIFIFQGFIIGVVGALLGTFVGYAVCWMMQVGIITIPLPPDVFYVSTVPVKIYPINFVIVGIAALLICLLATLYPARQAAKLSPVEVIRYE
ncbi:MAG: lipoprotein-releasing ABC transporter permease subunit [Candidatus Binatia bacterium]